MNTQHAHTNKPWFFCVLIAWSSIWEIFSHIESALNSVSSLSLRTNNEEQERSWNTSTQKALTVLLRYIYGAVGHLLGFPQQSCQNTKKDDNRQYCLEMRIQVQQFHSLPLHFQTLIFLPCPSQGWDSGRGHHAQFIWCMGQNPGLHEC